ncbi:MAG: 1-acyl-sn-glycerol-3-phosphate acyltransferase, partial [Candidatus Omnitrophica bacterium]|nr:1-acyl-sn-glycerol-3-phosphate acyltransferase [Candidatus Omnitrophota bacterium]
RPDAKKSWSQVLKELPPVFYLNKVKTDFNLLEKSLAWLFKCIFVLFLRVFWLLRVSGKQNLPRQGPYLICSNHASYLDGLFIFSSIPFAITAKMYFLGFQHIFEHPSLAWMNKIGRLITVNTSEHVTEAMQIASFLVAHKKIICIFPEGMRSISADVQDFKKGIGILIKELDLPVVPVYIKGSHYSWPRGTHFPRPHPIKVLFGPCLRAAELLEKKKDVSDKYEALAQALREEVLKLAC